jgi:ABC-type branched-subunit amino acid transport system substrate-binding protein
MTGKYKLVGDAVMRGIQLALKGSDIEVIVKDTQADPELAAKAVEELAFDNGVVGILGPLLDDEARRAALAAEELQVPVVTLTQAQGVTEIGPRVFRNMLTNAAQAKALVAYGTKVLGFKSFALLYPNKSFGVELANNFWDEVVAQGGSIRGAENYSYDQTTFTAEIKKLVGRYYLDDRAEYLDASKEIQAKKLLDPFRKRKALEKLRNSLEPIVDFDAIFVPDDWKRVTQLAPALAVEDIITNACDPKDLERIKKTIKRTDIKTVTLMGSAQWGGSTKGRSGLPEIIERGDKFIRCSVYVDGFFVDSERPATKKFVKLYRDTYRDATKDRDPGLLDAIGFDTAGIFRRILERGGVTTREDLRSRLSELKDFDGATGKTSFDANREAQKPLFLLTIESAGIRELAPDEKLAGSSS